MLTRGNRKLGSNRIWTFTLPSGTTETCPGMTPTCQKHCYAIALERFRPVATARYRRNLALTQRRNFARRMQAFLVAHAVRIVRVHVGGDFTSLRYARAWWHIMKRSSSVQFYFYTRVWTVPTIKPVIDRMAELPNCRVWYSVDRDTGVPTDVPARVRLAWLATTPEDRPPAEAHLIFRVRRLRSLPVPLSGPPVCPTETPRTGKPVVTCERCGHCWRPNPTTRIPLSLINPVPEGEPSARTDS
ncbi:MAG: hypothetical protein K8U57_17890 [Planctomycetes bacterium]|nr:hypothetical protein [Planctomycetota bacterium]